MPKKFLAANSGFTLLEVMIAIAIMAVGFASILMVETASIRAMERTIEMNTVAMLAKNQMVEAELEFQERTFGEVKEEDHGTFKAPHDKYSWTREIKEIKFPEFRMSAGSQSTVAAAAELIGKLITKFLSNALREVTVTISWQKGPGTKSFAITTYWVDLTHEFSLTP